MTSTPRSAEHTTGGAYINFLSDEGQDRVRAAYGDEAYGRLQALKRNYDPDNAFHRNQKSSPRSTGLRPRRSLLAAAR